MSERKPIVQSDEGISLAKLLAMGVFSVTVGLLAVALVYGVLVAKGLIGAQPEPRPGGRAGLLRRGLIDAPERPPRVGPPEPLERYGWADRSRGIAEIPIERAMEIVAARGR